MHSALAISQQPPPQRYPQKEEVHLQQVQVQGTTRLQCLKELNEEGALPFVGPFRGGRGVVGREVLANSRGDWGVEGREVVRGEVGTGKAVVSFLTEDAFRSEFTIRFLPRLGVPPRRVGVEVPLVLELMDWERSVLLLPTSALETVGSETLLSLDVEALKAVPDLFTLEGEGE